jgi:hypothetical protein
VSDARLRAEQHARAALDQLARAAELDPTYHPTFRALRDVVTTAAMSAIREKPCTEECPAPATTTAR